MNETIKARGLVNLLMDCIAEYGVLPSEFVR